MTQPTHEEIVQRCIKTIHDFVPELQDAPLTEDSTVNTDASMDSMSMILVISKLEAFYDVKIPDERWSAIQSLGELASEIETALQKKQQA